MTLACFLPLGFNACLWPVYAAPSARDRELEALISRAGQQNEDGSTRDAALNTINRAIEIAPENNRVWLAKSYILDRLEEYEQALSCVRKALQLDSQTVAAWGHQAVLLRRQGQLSEALASINRAIKLGDGPYYRCEKGKILWKMGKKVEAEAELDKALNVQPRDPLWLDTHSTMAAANGRWQAVIDDCSIIMTLPGCHGHNQSYYDILHRRADAYVHLQKYDKAIAEYKMAAKTFPEQRHSHELLLELFKKLHNAAGIKEEAIALKEFDEEFSPTH